MARSGELPFACRCGDRQAEMDQLLEEVLVAIGKHDNIAPPDKIEDLSVDLMVYALWEDFYATVESIGCDQWFGVSVEIFETDREKKDRVRHYVQCDRIVDGLARIYLHLHNEQKEKT